jgi:hypothetical protein
MGKKMEFSEGQIRYNQIWLGTGGLKVGEIRRREAVLKIQAEANIVIREELENHWSRYRENIIETHHAEMEPKVVNLRQENFDSLFEDACAGASITKIEREIYALEEYRRGVEHFGIPAPAHEIRQRVRIKLGEGDHWSA